MNTLHRRALATWATFACPFLAGVAQPALAQQPDARPVIQVGFVADRPGPRSEQLRVLIQDELLELTRNDFDIQFPEIYSVAADGTVDTVDAAVRRLLNDEEVDLVVTLDFLGSQIAATGAPWPTPVIASLVLDAELQGIPSDAGTSGVDGLSYLTIPAPVTEDLLTFRRMTPFDTVDMFIDEGATTGFPQFVDRLRREVSALGVNLRVIGVGTSAAEALGALPQDAEAAYLMPLERLSREELEALTSGLADRRLPSFSFAGERHVEAGVLASLQVDETPRRARRVALHAQRILLGDDAGALSVQLMPSEELVINMRTVNAIGVVPPLTLLLEARRLFDFPEGAIREVTLDGAIREAVQANLNLLIQDRTVASGAENIRLARSNLLPFVTASAGSRFTDATLGTPVQPQRAFQGSLGVEQLLYSDAVRADVSIERSLQDARVSGRDRVRLDVALDAAIALLNVLASKTFEQIRQDNLDLTRAAVRIAQVREQIGAAGPGERLRLQSELAQRRANGIEAYVQRRSAEIALNQVLNRPLDESFVTPEAQDGGRALIEDHLLTASFGDLGRFATFVRFLVQEAFDQSPELRALDANIAAQKRLLLARQRAFTVPTVSLKGDVSTNLFEGGAGTGGAPGSVTDFPWSVGVFATLPLFEGRARVAAREQASIDLDGLQVERDLLAQQIEQEVRTRAAVAFGSFATISETEDSAETARRSLELVSDAYAQGVAEVIDLLEAQNRRLVAELNVTSALFGFLADLEQVERAVGRFLALEDASERTAFTDRLLQFAQDAEVGRD